VAEPLAVVALCDAGLGFVCFDVGEVGRDDGQWEQGQVRGVWSFVLL
jgi:hypothetical protein